MKLRLMFVIKQCGSKATGVCGGLLTDGYF